MAHHLLRPAVGAGGTGDPRRWRGRPLRAGVALGARHAARLPRFRDHVAIFQQKVGAGCTGDSRRWRGRPLRAGVALGARHSAPLPWFRDHAAIFQQKVGAGCTGDSRRQARQAPWGLGRRRDSAPTGAPGWGRDSPAISPPRVRAGCTGDPRLLRPPVGAGCTGDLDTFSSHLLACHPELAPGRWRAYRRRDRWRGSIGGMRTTGGTWSGRAVMPRPRPRPGVRAPWQLIPWSPPLHSNRGSSW